jgi:hypothetical protein
VEEVRAGVKGVKGVRVGVNKLLVQKGTGT